jgi:hypothetical protein
MRTRAERPDARGGTAPGTGTASASAGGADAPGTAAPARPGRHISPIRVVRRPAAAVALIAGLLIAGVGVAGFAVASRTGQPSAKVTPIARNSFGPIPKGKWAAVPPASVQTVAEPVGLVIPAIRVNARLVHLGIGKDGVLQVPGTITVAGWYTGSPRPGEPGGAVIAGHVDGPLGGVETDGVFFLLRTLTAGEKIFVKRADGTLAVFTITEVRQYPKTGFPTSAVYGPTPDAQLRLITCGGTFDEHTGHYLSNTIVYASLTS